MKKYNYKNFKNLRTLSESESFKLSFDTSFISVDKKLVDQIDFENFESCKNKQNYEFYLQNFIHLDFKILEK